MIYRPAALFLGLMSGFFSSHASAEECGNTSDHGSFIGCEDQLMKSAKGTMDQEFKFLMDSAKAFDAANPFKNGALAASEEETQKHWMEFMKGECSITGMIALGASAPSPGYEICAKDMMRARTKALATRKAEFDQGTKAFLNSN